MIARNEEGIIGTAIASTKGLADEVVVLDTGSDDNTIAEARQAGARVLEGTGDRMNKAEARNHVIEYAMGDWVVILDCDEIIADPIGLRHYLETTDVDTVYVRLVFMSGNTPTLEYNRMLCWRKGTMEYRYRAHEVPLPVGAIWPSSDKTDFVWEHRPPAGRSTWKLQYTLDRLLLDAEEYPDDPRPMFYLGRQYTYLHNWEKGLEWLGKYLESNGWIDCADAWFYSARCYAGLNNRAEQIRALHRACAEMPKRREWWGTLAEIYHKDGDDNVAVGLLKYALEQPPPTDTYYAHYWFGSHIYDLTARCLWKLERHSEGLEYAEKALSLAPGSARLRENLRYFKQSRLNQLERVVPELYKPGKLLYVGANSIRLPEALRAMRLVGHEITLLEVWPENAAYHEEWGLFDHVVVGDVREIETLGLSRYDAILWWHGPEHIDIQDLPNTLLQLESLADIVVLSCPWGIMNQVAVYGNPHEEHSAYLQPGDFPLGYSTDTIGEVNARSGHLIAWRIHACI